MAGKKADDKRIAIENIIGASGEVNITVGDIYKHYPSRGSKTCLSV